MSELLYMLYKDIQAFDAAWPPCTPERAKHYAIRCEAACCREVRCLYCDHEFYSVTDAVIREELAGYDEGYVEACIAKLRANDGHHLL